MNTTNSDTEFFSPSTFRAVFLNELLIAWQKSVTEVLCFLSSPCPPNVEQSIRSKFRMTAVNLE
jgi:hypothetical protein